MPVIARQPTTTALPSTPLVAYVDALPYSLPALDVELINPSTTDTLVENYISSDVWPLGTRVAFCQTPTGSPVPIFVIFDGSYKASTPWSIYPLHNVVDLQIMYDPKLNIVHCFWWWNAWTPSLKLPKPTNWYAPHSVPSTDAPPWLKSVVPRNLAAPFDISMPFWIAPIVDQWRYDYFPGSGDAIRIGESKPNDLMRAADSPGLRYVQQAIKRGLIDYPGPPEPGGYSQKPSNERFLWEASGGIRAAGKHIAIASRRDSPEYIPDTEVDGDINTLPDSNDALHGSTTIEDHLIFVQALKAHQDHKNIRNATRVLMYASAQYINVNIKVSPQSLVDPFLKWSSSPWPSQDIPVKTVSTLLLDSPRPIASFPVLSNYQLLVNPTLVQYPEMGGSSVSFFSQNNGHVVSSSTPQYSLEPSLDYVIHDPTPAWAKNAEYYVQHLDVKSF